LQLAVINSKGLGAGPNLQGPNPYLDPESTDSQYVGSMIVGTLSLIDVPDQGELRQDTHQVFVNDHFFGAHEDQGNSVNAAAPHPGLVRAGNLPNSGLAELAHAFLLTLPPTTNGPNQATSAASTTQRNERTQADTLVSAPAASQIDSALTVGIAEDARDAQPG